MARQAAHICSVQSGACTLWAVCRLSSRDRVPVPSPGLTCTAAVCSATGASWTYCTWMSLACSEEPSTPAAAASAEATAISCAPWRT